MTRHRLILAILAGLVALPAQAAPDTLALHCGALFDARAGKLLDAHTVVVREGRIARSGR